MLEEIGEIAEERENGLELEVRLANLGFKQGLGFKKESFGGKRREKEREGRRERGDIALVVCRSSMVSGG